MELPGLFRRELRQGLGLNCGIFTDNMVNMVVLDDICLLPKPFGCVVRRSATFNDLLRPLEADEDVFEVYAQSQLEQLGVRCTFLNAWDAYSFECGGVHCATNVERLPDLPPQWWVNAPPVARVMATAAPGSPAAAAAAGADELDDRMPRTQPRAREPQRLKGSARRQVDGDGKASVRASPPATNKKDE